MQKLLEPDYHRVAHLLAGIPFNTLFAISGRVIPQFFWNSGGDFLKNGIGFCLMQGNTIISTCFSAFISANYLELGVETAAAFRGKGYAVFACQALIDYCLLNNFAPVWACRKENMGSFKLALKLGFEVSRQIPYYSLAGKPKE